MMQDDAGEPLTCALQSSVKINTPLELTVCTHVRTFEQKLFMIGHMIVVIKY